MAELEQMVRSKFNNMREDQNAIRDQSQEHYDILRGQVNSALSEIERKHNNHEIRLAATEELVQSINQSLFSLIDS